MKKLYETINAENWWRNGMVLCSRCWRVRHHAPTMEHAGRAISECDDRYISGDGA